MKEIHNECLLFKKQTNMLPHFHLSLKTLGFSPVCLAQRCELKSLLYHKEEALTLY